jgi:hypothetical protein
MEVVEGRLVLMAITPEEKRKWRRGRQGVHISIPCVTDDDPGVREAIV